MGHYGLVFVLLTLGLNFSYGSQILGHFKLGGGGGEIQRVFCGGEGGSLSGGVSGIWSF